MVIFHRYNQLGMMILGMAGMGVSLVMIGPWELIFERSFYYVVIGIPLFGIMLSALYGKGYLVPVQPHMITVAKRLYQLPDDDRLNDGISSISMISQSAGGIFGPLAGGFYLNYFSTDSLFVVTGLISIGYCVIVSSFSVMHRHVNNEESHEQLLYRPNLTSIED